LRPLSLLLICFILEISAAEPLITTKIIKDNSVCFHLSAGFSNKYVRHPLLLSYPQEIDIHSLPPSIVDIPLITNVIPVIWLSGKEYTIAEMDEDLYYSLITIKEFFKRFFYNTAWEGELKPDRLVKNILPQTNSKSAALFSGGLDSTTTVLRHFDEDLTLISFNDPHETAVEFAKLHHFNFYTIYMNHRDFLRLTSLDRASIDITKWFWDTTMSLSWVGAAAPFLYAKGIPQLYIPSGFTWQAFIFPDGQTLRQPACPLIDENLSPMGLRVQHDIFTMTRTDKIKFISTFCTERNIPKPQLIVCNYYARNSTSYTHCNNCMKCYLTMLDIVAIGQELQDYGFTLSQKEFIAQFRSYIETSQIRRGGTYVACYDTQNYLKQNIDKLPQTYRPFYDWFISIDLWAMINEPSNRPPRPSPFNWDDYQDLYRR
jgi:hypothetical protein